MTEVATQVLSLHPSPVNLRLRDLKQFAQVSWVERLSSFLWGFCSLTSWAMVSKTTRSEQSASQLHKYTPHQTHMQDAFAQGPKRSWLSIERHLYRSSAGHLAMLPCKSPPFYWCPARGSIHLAMAPFSSRKLKWCFLFLQKKLEPL